MRVDVPTLNHPYEHQAHGRPSVGVALDARGRGGPSGDVPRVAIRSWAARTAFGDLRQTWERLLRGESINDHARLADAGERNRALGLARLATSGLAVAPDAALIVGSSKGSVEEWFVPPPVASTSDNPSSVLSGWGLGDIASRLAADLGLRGPVLTLSAACASGLHALVRAAMMIRAGEIRQALVVATEASVHPLFLGNFQRLGVLAQPGAGCRPFDRRRTGFYMSEAACAIVLEVAEAVAAGPGHAAPVYIDRVAIGGDATHLTGGDPEGRLLRHLLHKVIDDRPVDLVHAHGTGTEANDATELAAVDAAVPEDRSGECPVVYSHKAALGHSLGASGLLSVVLNCMCHTTGVIPPNVRTTDALPAARVTIPHAATARRVRRSIAIAAGFGGPTAAVCIVSP